MELRQQLLARFANIALDPAADVIVEDRFALVDGIRATTAVVDLCFDVIGADVEIVLGELSELVVEIASLLTSGPRLLNFSSHCF